MFEVRLIEMKEDTSSGKIREFREVSDEKAKRIREGEEVRIVR